MTNFIYRFVLLLVFKSSVKRSYVQISFDDVDENENDIGWDSYVGPPAAKRVAPCNDPEEDWDIDMLQ